MRYYKTAPKHVMDRMKDQPPLPETKIDPRTGIELKKVWIRQEGPDKTVEWTEIYVWASELEPEEPEPKVEIGIWGERRRTFLKEHRKGTYTCLLVEGKLTEHLADVNQRARTMWETLIEQMAEREGVTEKLKAQDMMKWVRMMNNIRDRAREIVNEEVIYAGGWPQFS